MGVTSCLSGAVACGNGVDALSGPLSLLVKPLQRWGHRGRAVSRAGWEGSAAHQGPPCGLPSLPPSCLSLQSRVRGRVQPQERRLDVPRDGVLSRLSPGLLRAPYWPSQPGARGLQGRVSGSPQNLSGDATTVLRLSG